MTLGVWMQEGIHKGGEGLFIFTILPINSSVSLSPLHATFIYSPIDSSAKNLRLYIITLLQKSSMVPVSVNLKVRVETTFLSIK